MSTFFLVYLVLGATFWGVSFLIGFQGGLKHGEPLWGTILGALLVSVIGSLFLYGGLFWFLGGPEVSSLPAGEYVGAVYFSIALWAYVTGFWNLVLPLASLIASVWGFKLARARLLHQREA